MTIEEAVDILNANKHRHSAFYQGREWLIEETIGRRKIAVLNAFGDRLEFSEFEAIACAEKYERIRIENERSSFNREAPLFVRLREAERRR